MVQQRREREGERRPVQSGPHLNGAFVGLRDAADDGEAEPGARHPARVRRSVEALEDVREILGRDAGTLIADQDPAVLDDDAYRDLGRTPLDGVVDQVADGVIDRGGVDLHQARTQPGVDDRGGPENAARGQPRGALGYARSPDGERGEEQGRGAQRAVVCVRSPAGAYQPGA